MLCSLKLDLVVSNEFFKLACASPWEAVYCHPRAGTRVKNSKTPLLKCEVSPMKLYQR